MISLTEGRQHGGAWKEESGKRIRDRNEGKWEGWSCQRQCEKVNILVAVKEDWRKGGECERH